MPNYLTKNGDGAQKYTDQSLLSKAKHGATTVERIFDKKFVHKGIDYSNCTIAITKEKGTDTSAPKKRSAASPLAKKPKPNSAAAPGAAIDDIIVTMQANCVQQAAFTVFAIDKPTRPASVLLGHTNVQTRRVGVMMQVRGRAMPRPRHLLLHTDQLHTTKGVREAMNNQLKGNYMWEVDPEAARRHVVEDLEAIGDAVFRVPKPYPFTKVHTANYTGLVLLPKADNQHQRLYVTSADCVWDMDNGGAYVEDPLGDLNFHVLSRTQAAIAFPKQPEPEYGRLHLGTIMPKSLDDSIAHLKVLGADIVEAYGEQAGKVAFALAAAVLAPRNPEVMQQSGGNPILHIVGPPGCGKSTVASTLNGLRGKMPTVCSSATIAALTAAISATCQDVFVVDDPQVDLANQSLFRELTHGVFDQSEMRSQTHGARLPSSLTTICSNNLNLNLTTSDNLATLERIIQVEFEPTKGDFSNLKAGVLDAVRALPAVMNCSSRLDPMALNTWIDRILAESFLPRRLAANISMYAAAASMLAEHWDWLDVDKVVFKDIVPSAMRNQTEPELWPALCSHIKGLIRAGALDEHFAAVKRVPSSVDGIWYLALFPGQFVKTARAHFGEEAVIYDSTSIATAAAKGVAPYHILTNRTTRFGVDPANPDANKAKKAVHLPLDALPADVRDAIHEWEDDPEAAADNDGDGANSDATIPATPSASMAESEDEGVEANDADSGDSAEHGAPADASQAAAAGEDGNSVPSTPAHAPEAETESDVYDAERAFEAWYDRQQEAHDAAFMEDVPAAAVQGVGADEDAEA